MSSESVRRSGRVRKELAILLVGSDTEGKVFSESTKTVVLSRHGAGILSMHKLSPEQELIVRREETNTEAEVRVVGQLASQPGAYIYGMTLVNHNSNFWGVVFPPLTEAEREASILPLQCSSCETREMVQQSDLDADVFAINDGIVRFCKHCGSSTFWNRASDSAENELLPSETVLTEPEQGLETAAPAAPSPDLAPAFESEPRQENRRQHVRTKVNFKACVRSFTFGEDIVSCEDISRGGLRFKSRKPYAEKAQIEVAAPYAAGAAGIFVRAHIVYVHELPEQKLFRCGVAYGRT